MPNTTEIFCRKCECHYTPKYATLAAAKKANDELIFEEQHLSGLCSDECWDKCSDQELARFKYFEPLSLGSTKRVCVLSSPASC